MNYAKTAALLIVLTLLLVWMGSFIGGPRGAFIAFILALIMNGVSYWYSDKIVLAMYKAKELPEREFHHLYALVKDISRRANVPMPKIYMADMKMPNAFATGRDPGHAAVCVTKGILELLDEKELKGVLAHEMSHIKNRDTLIMTVTAAVAGGVMLLANMARWAAMFGGYSKGRRNSGNIFGLIAVSIIAPVAAMIVQLAISRSREYEADKKGAYLANDPAALARALKRLDSYARTHRVSGSPQTAHLFIINPFRGNFIANLFSTHPPMEERIKRLQRMAL